MKHLNASWRSPWQWLAVGIMAVHVRGLFIDVMEVDAAQYASIAMEMLQSGQWLQVQHRGADYLDKPPLLFWLSALSFAIFGLSNWAYKLPSLLAALLGVWSTYRFALLYYSPSVARHAAVILATSLGLILMTNDVRTDTLLLGFSTFAVWQLAAFAKTHRWHHWLLGFIAVGLAMLAKGPIGLVMPAFAVGSHMLLRNKVRQLLRWEWLAGLLIIGIILAPMCWGLWVQFDLHPEKWVNGRQGVSGLRFFFWEQSFGRITGENPWKNDASAFFFIHVYLWAFLPWSLLLPWALVRRGISLWRVRHLSSNHVWPEYYSLGGFVLTFIALSLSQYKLPHYIFITLPWAAVLVAAALRQGSDALLRWLTGIGAVVSILLGWVMVFWVFPESSYLMKLLLMGSTLLWGLATWRWAVRLNAKRAVLLGGAAACILGLALNFHFYPHLLSYQYTRRAVETARKIGFRAQDIVFFRVNHHSLDFYNGRILPRYDDPTDLLARVTQRNALGVITTPEGRVILEQAGAYVKQAVTLKHFHVAMLNGHFLNPTTRERVLQMFYLLIVEPSNSELKE
ncbi:MAG: glycosyltransferase family 39 protein [Saprospiraceae bacterium]|nr:glycosyltransferase family 39 protein [Saprospiraceae bacterium]MDW8482775.1 glycosyltransferase family 39 protein [Saprospiraceae bacterium]